MKTNDNEGAIMVIEDDERVREVLVNLLEDHPLFPFENGEVAVHWLKDHPQTRIDLAISDYDMPGINGVTTLIEIQRLRPEVKTVIMSGIIPEKLAAITELSGFDAWLVKPFSLHTLQSLVRKLVPVPQRALHSMEDCMRMKFGTAQKTPAAHRMHLREGMDHVFHRRTSGMPIFSS